MTEQTTGWRHDLRDAAWRNTAYGTEYPISGDDRPGALDLIHDKDRCARCGVFRYVHDEGGNDHAFRRASRLRLWLLDHDLPHHVRAWAWWRLTTERMRWRIAERLHRRRPDLCWCEMVDSILLQGAPRDYDRRYPYGDLCNVPVLHQVRPFVPGRCYCSPAEVRP